MTDQAEQLRREVRAEFVRQDREKIEKLVKAHQDGVIDERDLRRLLVGLSKEALRDALVARVALPE